MITKEGDPLRERPFRSLPVLKEELLERLRAIPGNEVVIVGYPLSGGVQFEAADNQDVVDQEEQTVVLTPSVDIFPALSNRKRREIEPRELSVAEQFVRAVQETTFAAAKDQTRPIFQGVLFKFEDDGLTLVAADGFRIGISSRVPIHTAKPIEIIIEAEALRRACQTLFPQKGENTDVKITVGIAGIHITSNNGNMFFHDIPGSFPNVKHFVPELSEGVLLPRGDLLKSMQRLMQDVPRQSRRRKSDKDVIYAVGIEFLDGEEKLRLRRRDILPQGSSFDQTKEEFVHVQGATQARVGFVNCDFLLDLLTHVNVGTLHMTTANQFSAPVVFRKPGDPDFVHLIMPVNSTWSN